MRRTAAARSGQRRWSIRKRCAQKESLKLAKAELTRQAGATTHPVRKKQIDAAIAEIDKRLKA